MFLTKQVVFISVATAWESEIKRALGKLDAPLDLEEQLRRLRFSELPVHFRHVHALRDLPHLHRDPCDRILIAQAATDALTLVTRNDRIRAYAIRTLAA